MKCILGLVMGCPTRSCRRETLLYILCKTTWSHAPARDLTPCTVSNVGFMYSARYSARLLGGPNYSQGAPSGAYSLLRITEIIR